MRFAIKRASDSVNDCKLRGKPCKGALPIPVIVQVFRYRPDRYEYCDNIVFYIDLDLNDLMDLVQSEGDCIIKGSPYEAMPGYVGDDSLPHWDVPIKARDDNQQNEIISIAGSIIIYDDYME